MILKLFKTIFFFILLDIIWFQFSFDTIYNPSVIAIQGHPIKLRILSGLFAWTLLAIGVNYFVINHNNNNNDKLRVLVKGALFGFIVYGVYNGTLRAIFSNYDMKTFMADLTWGTFATSIVSLIISYF